MAGTERPLPEPVARAVVIQSDGLSVTPVRLYDPCETVFVELGRDGAVLLQEISGLDRIGGGDRRFLERMTGIDPAAAQRQPAVADLQTQLGDASSPQRRQRGGDGQFLPVDLEGDVYLPGILRRNEVEIVRDAVVQQAVRKHRAHTVGIGASAVQPPLERNQEACGCHTVSLYFQNLHNVADIVTFQYQAQQGGKFF